MPTFRQPNCGHHIGYYNRHTGRCVACDHDVEVQALEPDVNDFVPDPRMPTALINALGRLSNMFPRKQITEMPNRALRDIATDFKEDFGACPASELGGFESEFMEVDVDWLKRVVTYLNQEHKGYDLGCSLADEVMVSLGHHLEVASL